MGQEKEFYEKKRKLDFEKIIESLDDETKFKFWIKSILNAFNTIPEIIKTVDKIIELQATSVSFVSDIFNGKNNTLNQMEKVIDLTERKNSLVNIYLMTKEMLKGIDENDKSLIENKYTYNWTIDEISQEYDISVRTVYRKLSSIIDEIYQKLKKKNWSVAFIENQIKNEGWIKEKYQKFIIDYIKNSNYKELGNF